MTIGTVTMNPAVDKYIHIDRFILHGLNRVVKTEKYPGGKGFNVSMALERQGMANLALGCTGGDNGQFIRAELERLGVRHYLTEIKGQTRTNMKLLETTTGKVTEVNEPGPVLEPADLEAVRREILTVGKSLQYLVLTGSLPRGVSADFYGEITQALRTFDVGVIVDADGESLRHGIAGKPLLVKPNRYEVEQYLGVSLREQSDFCRAAEEFQRRGIHWVVITDGAAGALFTDGTAFVWAEAPPMEVKSTVGCGDALLAGLLAGLVRKQPVVECARWALATATATAMEEGTSFPDCSKIDSYVKLIQIREL